MKKPRLALTAILLALVLPAQVLAAQPDKAQRKLDKALQHALKTGNGNAPVRVIVQATAGHENAVRALLKGKGNVHNEHKFIKAFTATVKAKDLEDLADSDDVDNVSLDADMTPDQEVDAEGYRNAPAGASDKLRATLGIDVNTITGIYVGVAVIDSGIANVRDFSGRITAFYDFTQGTAVATSPYDDYGHGTHVAGLIGGDGSTSPNGQYQGVAPNVRLIGMKVLDGNGAGSTSAVISALEFATVNKRALGIDIINLSLGHPIYESAKTDPLVLAVEKAVHAGIVVVVSAGNWGTNPTTGLVGYAGITSPGNARSAITVGAVDMNNTSSRGDDTIADYSSRGPSWYDAYAKPDLVAPGSKLVAPIGTNAGLYKKHPELQVTASNGNKFLSLSGTSMASAVMAGVAALTIRSHRYYQPYLPDLPPNTVKAILEFTATPMYRSDGTMYDRLTQGAGEVNAIGAIKLASYMNVGPHGQPCLTANISMTSTIGNQVIVWGQDVIWGDELVHGADIIWAEDIIWGDDVIWGQNVVVANDVIWGEDIVWGDDVIWGEDIIWAEDVVWGDDVIWGEDVIWGDELVSGYSLPSTTTWGDLTASSVLGGVR